MTGQTTLRLSPAEIQAVPCPLCAAGVARPCVTMGRQASRRIEYGHTERTNLALKVVAALDAAWALKEQAG